VDADPAGPTRCPHLTTTKSTATSQEQDCRPDNACSGATSSSKVRSPSPNRTGVNGGWGPNPLATGWRPRQAQVSGGREPSAVTARGPSWRFGNRQGIREGPNSSMCSHPNQRLHNTALPRSRPSLDSAHSSEANHPSGTHSPNGLRLYTHSAHVSPKLPPRSADSPGSQCTTLVKHTLMGVA